MKNAHTVQHSGTPCKNGKPDFYTHIQISILRSIRRHQPKPIDVNERNFLSRYLVDNFIFAGYL